MYLIKEKISTLNHGQTEFLCALIYTFVHISILFKGENVNVKLELSDGGPHINKRKLYMLGGIGCLHY